MRPTILTITGSDCSGGAGVQADLLAVIKSGMLGGPGSIDVVAEILGRGSTVSP